MIQKKDTGEETLKILETSKINKYVYGRIRDFLGRRVLEIGSGIGNISKYVIKDRKNKDLVILSDISKEYLTKLKKTFYGEDIKIIECDLKNTQVQKLKRYKIDTIICLNVLEHIKDDRKALNNMYNILNKDGTLVLLVPNLPILYGELDKKLNHFRRYSKKSLLKKLKKRGFDVKEKFYINFCGIFGWFINSKILKRNLLRPKEIALYDKLIPIFAVLDRITKHFTGLSLVCICTKS